MGQNAQGSERLVVGILPPGVEQFIDERVSPQEYGDDHSRIDRSFKQLHVMLLGSQRAHKGG